MIQSRDNKTLSNRYKYTILSIQLNLHLEMLLHSTWTFYSLYPLYRLPRLSEMSTDTSGDSLYTIVPLHTLRDYIKLYRIYLVFHIVSTWVLLLYLHTCSFDFHAIGPAIKIEQIRVRNLNSNVWHLTIDSSTQLTTVFCSVTEPKTRNLPRANCQSCIPFWKELFKSIWVKSRRSLSAAWQK